jgi:hypothetical protein
MFKTARCETDKIITNGIVGVINNYQMLPQNILPTLRFCPERKKLHQFNLHFPLKLVAMHLPSY